MNKDYEDNQNYSLLLKFAYLIIFTLLFAGLVIEAQRFAEKYFTHQLEIKKMEIEACLKMDCASPVPGWKSSSK